MSLDDVVLNFIALRSSTPNFDAFIKEGYNKLSCAGKRIGDSDLGAE